LKEKRRETERYELHLEGVQGIKWDKDDNEPEIIIHFSRGMRIINWEQSSSRIRESHQQLRWKNFLVAGCQIGGHWCDNFILNVQAPVEDKIDGTKESTYEESECVSDKLPKYHITIFYESLMPK
jgi:hypothetical protein